MSQISRYVLQQQEALSEALIDCNRNERIHENQRINQQNFTRIVGSAKSNYICEQGRNQSSIQESVRGLAFGDRCGQASIKCSRDCVSADALPF